MARGLLQRLRGALGPARPLRQSRLLEPLPLGPERLQIPRSDTPLAIRLGNPGRVLHLLPDPLLEAAASPDTNGLVLLDPERRDGRIGGFLRLDPGGDIRLDPTDVLQQALFSAPDDAAGTQLAIRHQDDSLIFHKRSSTLEVQLFPLPPTWAEDDILRRRHEQLREIRLIFGGPIEPLAPSPALDTLRQVNDLLENEPMRPRDAEGRPGGVVRVPDRMTPIIIGDLHAQVDNLLTLLSQNEFLEALGDGSAAMLFLGDAVHKETDGELEEMESSLLMMDLIFRLKLWFPQQVFYIRGNHDCFREDVGKQGIPQGLLWDRKVRKSRGEAYKQEMDRFYDLLPYVALSGDFVACHAAAPKSRVDLDRLINARSSPGLIRELTCNRLYAGNRPGGYTRGDVKRLRKALGLADDADLFVGHTPLNRSETLWSDVGGIPHHHVVFSGNQPWVGVVTRVRGRFVPLRYPGEPLLTRINALPDA